jgi:hypothetical protein
VPQYATEPVAGDRLMELRQAGVEPRHADSGCLVHRWIHGGIRHH